MTAIHNSVENGPKNTFQSRYSFESMIGIYIASCPSYIGGKNVPNCDLSGNMMILPQRISTVPSNMSLKAPSPSKIYPFDNTLGDPTFISFLKNTFALKLNLVSSHLRTINITC